ncbi:MAG: phosphohydrolase [Desulfobacterales bacterium]|nr:phosphohydrolase [Desulfobacterales bacterium]
MVILAAGRLDPLAIIGKYYQPGSQAHRTMIQHAEPVTGKSLDIAREVPHLSPDLDFIYEAAMLHDIGIFMTNAPSLGCHGDYPYICHGILGQKLLEGLNFPKHARVCERHVGVGITADEIRNQNLPLPIRDMTPKTVEEKIICYADKFFSKGSEPDREKSIEEIISGLELYGKRQVSSFLSLVDEFSVN